MGNVRSSAAYRIAISYAAVFAWSVLLLGATVYAAVDAEFHRRRDSEIAVELDRLSHVGNRAELLRELRWRQDHPAGNRFAYAMFDERGKRVAGNLDLVMPAETGFADFARPGEQGGGQSLRVGTRDASDEARLSVALNGDDYGSVNLTIFKYFLIAFAAMLVLGTLSGWALARYLRSRLEPIGATAHAIVAGDLAPRVPIGTHGDEFDAAGQAFNLMLDRIAGLMENLRQVSSDIAHDLRKPLIRLLSQADRLGQVEGAEDRLLEIGDEMLALFSAILRIAEVEGGGLERSFEEFDLSHLMTEVCDSFAPALADAGDRMEWTIEPDVCVLGSKELLAQLAANLLDNARIHTPPGTTIKLTVASRGGQAILSVEDDGPGVGPEDRDKLFQRFFRADASRTTPGNGLGLSLVTAAAHAHGGTVAVEDADPGLRVVVMLPRLRPGSDAEDRSSGRESGVLAFLRARQ